MTLDGENTKMYWQTGNGDKHSIPDGATLYVKRANGRGFLSFALDEKGDVVVGKERRKIPAALLRLINAM